MGDLRSCSLETIAAESSPSLEFSNKTAFDAPYWQRAEAVTQRIISQVQPSLVSEERRKEVIDYVQTLIASTIGCQVFPFGSVPLKTYLPDGDIDLTAFGGMNVEEALANDVYSVLEREEQNKAAAFIVKDVQLIRAEVKLVKCLVQNVVVDISFNQLGGLCTLCFLEEVDQLIGKDNLFKRSIILIKAWCYYESRILGAHHGLISTYALEILVLYIFHLFHSSLNGPLAVLYKFLDYFSKFDWDNYCISLNGSVRMSSLPEFVVEMPENDAYDLFLSNDFLKDSVDKFSVSTKGVETKSRKFLLKHLNIVDPLKENNNLGRSVSKGNFYRIRSAFTYGARKLGHILSEPEENVSNELCKFFLNTLDRHGNGQRPDVQDSVTMDVQYGFGATLPFPRKDSCQEQTNPEPASSDSSGIPTEGRLDHKPSLHNGVNVKAPSRQMSFGRTVNFLPNSSIDAAISENLLCSDAKDLVRTRFQDLSISPSSPRTSAPNHEETTSSVGKALNAPHLYFSCTDMANGGIRNKDPEQKQHESSGFTKESSYVVGDNLDNQLVSHHEVPSSIGSISPTLLFNSIAWSSEDLYPGHSGSLTSVTTARSPVAMTSLADLSGDYTSHVNNLYYGRLLYDYGLNASVPSTSASSLPQFQSKNSRDVIRKSGQFRQNMFSQMNVNCAIPMPVFYPMHPPLVPGAAFGMEEIPKPRGTGTYIPNTNHYRDRPFTSRGKNQAPIRSPCNYGRTSNFQETTLHERNSRELSQAQFYNYLGVGKSGQADLHHSGSAASKPYDNVNGLTYLSERVVDFGSMEHPPPAAAPLVESGRQSNPNSVSPRNVSTSILSSGTQRPKPVLAVDQDRISMQSYQLKDEDDFPPLSDSSGKGSPVSMVVKLEQ